MLDQKSYVKNRFFPLIPGLKTLFYVPSVNVYHQIDLVSRYLF